MRNFWFGPFPSSHPCLGIVKVRTIVTLIKELFPRRRKWQNGCNWVEEVYLSPSSLFASQREGFVGDNKFCDCVKLAFGGYIISVILRINIYLKVQH